jgi:hypothetical protein
MGEAGVGYQVPCVEWKTKIMNYCHAAPDIPFSPTGTRPETDFPPPGTRPDADFTRRVTPGTRFLAPDTRRSNNDSNSI